MHRFFLPAELAREPVIFLTDREAHHAVHVLRLRHADKVTVLDGAGQHIEAEVLSTARDRVGLKVLSRSPGPALPCQVTLLQAIPKGKLIESIVQKATELGVSRIVPLLSERVVRQLGVDQSICEAEKLRAVAIEAIKQCGCPWLPKVEIPATIEAFLSRKEPCELPLVASLQEHCRHPRDWFRRFTDRQLRLPKSICVWIGPEGDFTPTELDSIQTSGALPITLGPFVLRTETAAIYSLSVINYEAQLLSRSPAGFNPSGPGSEP
jgi:16S rRNA (uracil1498-N3)-methyltransferase